MRGCPHTILMEYPELSCRFDRCMERMSANKHKRVKLQLNQLWIIVIFCTTIYNILSILKHGTLMYLVKLDRYRPFRNWVSDNHLPANFHSNGITIITYWRISRYHWLPSFRIYWRYLHRLLELVELNDSSRYLPKVNLADCYTCRRERGMIDCL